MFHIILDLWMDLIQFQLVYLLSEDYLPYKNICLKESIETSEMLY